MDKNDEVQPEQIEDYCRQLGLQLRDEQEISMDDASQMTVLGSAVDVENPNENGHPLPPGHTKLGEQDKANFECKNCEKNFANSRQFLKHKCISKDIAESQRKPKGKHRGRKPRVHKAAAATEGISVEVNVDGASKAEVEVEEQIDHLSDHTYIKDDDVSLSTSNALSKNIQCDSCQLLAEIDPESFNSPNKIPCEKCQELAAVEVDALKSTDATGSNEENKPKRKYSFKNEKKNCPHCNKGFHSEKRFEKHLTVCKKNLVCPFCQEDFSYRGRMAYIQYQAHYYTHVDTKPFTCDVCSRGFIRKADLDRHRIIHTENYSPQRCNQCGAVFASAENLAKHMDKHARQTLSCNKCGQQFARQGTLDKHVVVCQTEKSCEVCGKVFKCLSKNVKSRYQEHMFIHTGEKPYKCQFCERGFRDRSTRRKHERTHTGEKPYPCTVCDRAFSQLRLLRNHVRTHTGEKPYACDLCPLSFAKSCNLKYHMRVHTKEKPYTCSICLKSFTQSGTYHKHLRRHLENNTPSRMASEKEVAATMIQFQTADQELLPEELNQNSETTNDSSLVPEAIPMVVDPEDTEVGTSCMVPEDNSQLSEDANQPTDSTLPEMPAISSEEITIIVSESDDVTSTLATIDVDQISSILASCS